MTARDIEARFARCAVLVIGDFGEATEVVRRLRAHGARVEVAGTGDPAAREELQRLGVEAEGVVDAPGAVLDAALDRLAIADAVLFATAGWDDWRKEVFEIERDQAVADGRSLRPLLAKSDPRYDFLNSPGAWAAFTLARAAGADFETAQRYSATHGGRSEGGHKGKDSKSGRGSNGRKRTPGRRRAD